MFDLIRTYQLDIMLALSAICLSFALLLFCTKFIEKRRKYILITMEFVATFLLFSDRLSFIYGGDQTRFGYSMLRLSVFLVFFFTIAVVFVFNLYLLDLFKFEKVPRRLRFISLACAAQLILLLSARFMNLIYYFDENNVYHRGHGFLLCFIIPIVCPLIQFTVIIQNRHKISKLIFTSLILYIYVPIIMGIIQFFQYGVSIVNMAMVCVSIFLYVFTYLDINDTITKSHNLEMNELQEEKRSMKRLFDQTATAFVTAVEKRDAFSEGHAARVARYAKKIAEAYGKSEEECDEIYYAALLHDVGITSLPDRLVGRTDDYNDEEKELIENVPVISGAILSSIKEYPYLTEAALCSHEQFDGNGYPHKLEGNAIPEIARIIAVADDYVSMISKNSYRGPLPYQTVREDFIRQSGNKYDSAFADIMIHIMDAENEKEKLEETRQIESRLTCVKYRSAVSTGIPILQEKTKVLFTCKSTKENQYSEPALILFDSFDGLIHEDPKVIPAYHYVEYGEVWFDGHFIATDVRNMEAKVLEDGSPSSGGLDGEENLSYEIIAAKYEDHIKLELLSVKGKVDVIMALPDSTKSAYMSLTGENCRINDIQVIKTDEVVGEDDITKIVKGISYIDRLESDIPNIQIDRYRSAATEGIKIDDQLKLDFHTMTLPTGSLVWHCPHLLIYSSEDKKVGGPGYREYAIIKLNGEIAGDEEFAENKFVMKKLTVFPGWDVWKETNKVGLECSVSITKKGGKITLVTENLGIAIENVTTILDASKDVYVALTGDEVALTDIRIR